ncbi:acyl-ACP--UDP-N-acetylglucosamine O-acyltransferase [Planctomicrobium sp. SH664]|uniref:acyl-ACP--UDP-N-acetylglucosamine O-acyltransferase n=1 Tax=Planctomicrobium sp. SH664 TaxID=3448125 RepID=UPI003F5C1867
MPIHPTAVIDSRAVVDPTAIIGPFVVIEGAVTIGANCRLAAGVTIYGPTTIGAGTQIHSHAVIGDFPQDRAFEGQDSSVRIGENCIIRECATIHRGTQPGSETIVGNHCFIMTCAHVGHNCVLADGVTMISGSLLGGHVHIGTRSVISGNAAVHQFVRIGELAMISGLAKVVQDIPPFFMTDRDGALVGVNRVGLLRSGLNSRDRDEIKRAYKIFYRSGYNRTEALRELKESITSEAGQRLIAFLSADSKRGIAGDAVEERLKGTSRMHAE